MIVANEDQLTVNGSPCDDIIVASKGTTEIFAGAGNDVVFGAQGVAAVYGGPGEDVLYADGADVVVGGADDDEIYGSSPNGAGPSALLADSAPVFLDGFKKKRVANVLRHRPRLVSHLADDPIEGHSGENVLFGGSGNDEIHGRAGDDVLLGNIGDDDVYGEEGDDLVAGGQGGDLLEGGVGSDWTRGDGTQDRLLETTTPNPGDMDTVSFASAVTPGFTAPDPGKTNFPSASGERGLYFKMANSSGATQSANNGEARDGGGDDFHLVSNDLSRFEVIVGSPFADYIIGSDNADTIFGGGGADVIFGAGGDDIVNGGASGDSIDGGTGTNTINGDASLDYCVNGSMSNCNEAWSGPTHVVPRDQTKVAVGFMSEVRNNTSDNDFLQLYALGSSGNDNIVVDYFDPGGSVNWVTFALGAGSSFDTDGLEQTAGCNYANANANPKTVTCSFQDHRKLDVLTVAGMAGDDTITLGNGFGESIRYMQPMLLGGPGNDTVTGDETYDLIVDGSGNDNLYGEGRDDGLINQAGLDHIYAGGGDDLLLNTTICDASDYIGGGEGTRNNASWIQSSSTKGAYADLTTDKIGLFDASLSPSSPYCSNASNIGTLINVQNLEGTSLRDKLVGDTQENSLLGWLGDDVFNGKDERDIIMGYAPSGAIVPPTQVDDDHDTAYGSGGNDSMLMYDGTVDLVIDCGEGSDGGKRDSGESAAPNCENVTVGP